MRHVYVSTRDAGLRPAAPRSDTAPNPDDNRVRFTAWLLPSGKVPQVTNAECVNTGSAVIYFNLAKDAASTTADFDVHSGLDSGGMIRGGGACLVVVVLAGSSGVGAQEAAAGPITNPVPLGAKSIATGGRLFQKYCKACHNADATGDGPLAPKDVHPPNLTDADWKYGATDGEIFTNIRDGIGPQFDMKPMKSRMTATEIWNVVNYLRSIGSKTMP